MTSKSRAEGFGDEVQRRILIGTYALSAGYSDAYYKKAQKVRTLIRNDFDYAFKKVDVLLTPVSLIEYLLEFFKIFSMKKGPSYHQ